VNQEIDYEVWIGTNEDDMEMYAGSSDLKEAIRYSLQAQPGELVRIYKVTRELVVVEGGEAEVKYWFKPWTHWHEVTQEAYHVLLRAGYEADQLKWGRVPPT
jgi:hypothetical protein